MIFGGHPYWFDAGRCWRRYIELLVGGDVSGLDDLAVNVGVSRSTVSRFLSGRSTAPITVRRMLNDLGLRFEDVFEPVHDADGDGAGLGEPATVWD